MDAVSIHELLPRFARGAANIGRQPHDKATSMQPPKISSHRSNSSSDGGTPRDANSPGQAAQISKRLGPDGYQHSAALASATSSYVQGEERRGQRQGQGQGEADSGSPASFDRTDDVCSVDEPDFRCEAAGDASGALTTQGRLAGECEGAPTRTTRSAGSQQCKRVASPGHCQDKEVDEASNASCPEGAVHEAVATVHCFTDSDAGASDAGKGESLAKLCGQRGDAPGRDRGRQGRCSTAGRCRKTLQRGPRRPGYGRSLDGNTRTKRMRGPATIYVATVIYGGFAIGGSARGLSDASAQSQGAGGPLAGTSGEEGQGGSHGRPGWRGTQGYAFTEGWWCAGFKLSPLPSLTGLNGRPAGYTQPHTWLSMCHSVQKLTNFVSHWMAPCHGLQMQFASAAADLGVHVGFVDPRIEPDADDPPGTFVLDPWDESWPWEADGAAPHGQLGVVEPSFSPGPHSYTHGSSTRILEGSRMPCPPDSVRQDCLYSLSGSVSFCTKQLFAAGAESPESSSCRLNVQPGQPGHHIVPEATRNRTLSVRFCPAVQFWFPAEYQLGFATPGTRPADPMPPAKGGRHHVPGFLEGCIPRIAAPLLHSQHNCDAGSPGCVARPSVGSSNHELQECGSLRAPDALQDRLHFPADATVPNMAPALEGCSNVGLPDQDVFEPCDDKSLHMPVPVDVTSNGHATCNDDGFASRPPLPAFCTFIHKNLIRDDYELVLDGLRDCSLPQLSSDRLLYISGHTPAEARVWSSATPLTCCHSAFLTAAPALQCPKDQPTSKAQAIRLAGTPHLPPSRAARTGFSRPLELAGHTEAIDLTVSDPEADACQPFTSFDERLGVRILAGDPNWPIRHFASHAILTAGLPGQPIARPLGYEVVSHPGPQIALTQDRGSDHRRAVIFDFRSHGHELATIDLVPGTNVLQAFGLVPPFPGLGELSTRLHSALATCYVNGFVVDVHHTVPFDADVVQFLDQPVAQAPHVLAAARCSAPPLPQRRLSHCICPPTPSAR